MNNDQTKTTLSKLVPRNQHDPAAQTENQQPSAPTKLVKSAKNPQPDEPNTTTLQTLEKLPLQTAEAPDPAEEQEQYVAGELLAPEHFAAQLTQHLLQIIPNQLLEAVRENPLLQLPYVSAAEFDDRQWLDQALKTILTPEQIELFAEHLQHNFFENRNSNNEAAENPLEAITQQFAAEKKQLIEELERQKNKVEQLKIERENLQISQHRQRERLASSIEIGNFVAAFFQFPEDEDVRRLLLEALESPTKDLRDFTQKFAQAWVKLKNCLQKLPSNPSENEKLVIVRSQLSELLQSLSGLYILERRSLLDCAARFASEHFADFLFVSPEQTKQVDPSIHNAQGLGGTNIAEGLSFAVVRRATLKTVFYADVKIEETRG